MIGTLTPHLFLLRQNAVRIALFLALGCGVTYEAVAQVITEFPIRTHLPCDNMGLGPAPTGLAVGSDGALWFNERFCKRIGRITTAGVLTEFPVPADDLFGIASGSDGALWFNMWVFEMGTIGRIGRITTTGEVSAFPVPLSIPLSIIVPGPDGNLYATRFEGGLYRISPLGNVVQLTPFVGGFITSGPDGALWNSQQIDVQNSRIRRITLAGVITNFLVPNRLVGPITSGPDGALWFGAENEIGRITTSGEVTFFPSSGRFVNSITTGPDGALWYMKSNVIGRMTISGVERQFPIPNTYPGVGGTIVAGPDGALWFDFPEAHLVGRITTGAIGPVGPVEIPTLSWPMLGLLAIGLGTAAIVSLRRLQ